MIKVYRQPQPQEFFVIGADPAEGGDNSVYVVLSKKNAEVIMVGQSKEESSQLGHELNHVGRWLEKKTGIFPSIAVEKNVGSATIYVLKTLNYPNLFMMPGSFVSSDPTQSQDYGWSTNSATRPKMLDDLALAIRQQAIKIPSKPIIDELYSFIRNARNGKPEADHGSHDDLVMALSISWQLYQIAPNPAVDSFDMVEWQQSEYEDQKNVKKMLGGL